MDPADAAVLRDQRVYYYPVVDLFDWRPEGVVCCIDKMAVTEPATELVERGVRDGRRFTIVDHPRPPERVIQAFAAAGLSVDVETIGDRSCVAWGTAR